MCYILESCISTSKFVLQINLIVHNTAQLMKLLNVYIPSPFLVQDTINVIPNEYVLMIDIVLMTVVNQPLLPLVSHTTHML